MAKPGVCLALLLLVLSCPAAFTQEGRDLVLRAVKALQEKPSEKETKDLRSEALRWVIETDEVSIVVCSLVDPFADKKNKFGGELTAAYTLGMAAFKLENPAKADENEVQLAGVETALKTYEKLVAEKPKNRSAEIDALIAKRDKKELNQHIAAADCGKKPED